MYILYVSIYYIHIHKTEAYMFICIFTDTYSNSLAIKLVHLYYFSTKFFLAYKYIFEYILFLVYDVYISNDTYIHMYMYKWTAVTTVYRLYVKQVYI